MTLQLVAVRLGESYLLDFPGGAPQAEPYSVDLPASRAIPARAVVSLPDYVGGPEGFTEADYLLAFLPRGLLGLRDQRQDVRRRSW